MRISNTTHDMPDIENNNIMNPPLVDDIELQQCPTSVVTTSIENKTILDTNDDATAATTATTDDDEGNKTNRSMKKRKMLIVCVATILTLFVIGACLMMANTVVFAIGGTRVRDNGVKMKCQNGKSLQRN